MNISAMKPFPPIVRLKGDAVQIDYKKLDVAMQAQIAAKNFPMQFLVRFTQPLTARQQDEVSRLGLKLPSSQAHQADQEARLTDLSRFAELTQLPYLQRFYGDPQYKPDWSH